jgi:hypothetical protein
VWKSLRILGLHQAAFRGAPGAAVNRESQTPQPKQGAEQKDKGYCMQIGMRGRASKRQCNKRQAREGQNEEERAMQAQMDEPRGWKNRAAKEEEDVAQRMEAAAVARANALRLRSVRSVVSPPRRFADGVDGMWAERFELVGEAGILLQLDEPRL